jgi:hypothetical protein
MENETRVRRERRGRPYWETQIENWRQSGLSQAEYCRREGIVPQYFTNWKSKLSARTTAHGFVEVSRVTESEVVQRRARPYVEFRIDEDLRMYLSLGLPGFLRGLFGGAA